VLGRKAGLPFTLLSVVCAISPDFEKVIAKLLDRLLAFTLAPIWSERGVSHSLFFAVLLSLLVTFLVVRRRWSSEQWYTVSLVTFFVTASHGLIDVFVGTNGVALLAPLSTTRYLHPMAAIPSIRFWQHFTVALGPVLLAEVLWIWIPIGIFFVLIRLAARWT
jgi:inner membrane protein